MTARALLFAAGAEGAPQGAGAPRHILAGVVGAVVGAGAVLLSMLACMTAWMRRRGRSKAACAEDPPAATPAGSAASDDADDNFWIYESVAGGPGGAHRGGSKPSGLPTPRSPGEGGAMRGGSGGSGTAVPPPFTGHDSDEMLLGVARNHWAEPGSWTGRHNVSGGAALRLELRGSGRAHSGPTLSSAGSEQLREALAGADWEIQPHELSIDRDEFGNDVVLGEGAFGQVFRGTLNEVQTVAIKAMMGQGDLQHDRFVREIALLKACHSTYVVQFLGACMTADATLLVTELMEGGSVQHALARGAMHWHNWGWRCAVDAARGMAYLHQRRIAHLDIKSANILLTAEGRAKLADVGLAHYVATAHIGSLDALGTLAYAAPELLAGSRCSEMADIWSFGVLLHELVSREPPQRGKLRELRVPEDCAEDVAALIEECMRFDPAERPTAKQIISRLARACGGVDGAAGPGSAQSSRERGASLRLGSPPPPS